MALLGSHLSIAGGYYKAVEAAAELRMDCVQIFTKNNNQWKGKPLTDNDISRFREAIVRTGIRMPCGTTAISSTWPAPTESLWSRSLEAFIIELERAEALGLVGVVMHPGASVGASEEEALARIVTAIERALEKTDGFSVRNLAGDDCRPRLDLRPPFRAPADDPRRADDAPASRRLR